MRGREPGLTRRSVLIAGSTGSAVFASGAFLLPRRARADEETAEFVRRTFGRPAAESNRLHLVMPAEFPTGSIVPMTLDVDCPMTETDHVKQIRVFAPQNPLTPWAAVASA